MPLSKQQAEALTYFGSAAREWQAKADGKRPNEVNVIVQRNSAVLRVADSRSITHRSLDVGCGTGDLVYEMAERGVHAAGVDFSPEMIAIARERTPAAIRHLVGFEAASIFEYQIPPSTLDLISANGFIEYISLDQLRKFLAICYDGLTAGGHLVVGSRNRLFNLFSLNQFSVEELDTGVWLPLYREALALATASSIDDLQVVEPAPLPRMGQEYLHTGIGVATRYQFTPLQLRRLMADAGFDVVGLECIHVHATHPAFKAKYPQIHVQLASLLQAFSTDIGLLPQSSSFMIVAKKG